MDMGLANRLARSVRDADPDRYFSALFAPPPQRPLLFALYAFNVEVARVAETCANPCWAPSGWNGGGRRRRGRPMVRPATMTWRGLAALFAARPAALAGLEALVAARSFDSSADYVQTFAEFESYVDGTSGTLNATGGFGFGGQYGQDGGNHAPGRAGLWHDGNSSGPCRSTTTANAVFAAGPAGQSRDRAGRVLPPGTAAIPGCWRR